MVSRIRLMNRIMWYTKRLADAGMNPKQASATATRREKRRAEDETAEERKRKGRYDAIVKQCYGN
jgi:hypothetical protein